MQSVEIVVFFIFAVVVGTLVLAYISDFDFVSMQRTLTCIFVPNCREENGISQINTHAFFAKAADCYRDCAFGAIDLECGTHHIKADMQTYGESFDHNALAEYFEKNNICTECNFEITDPPLRIPSIAKLYCDSNSSMLIIEN